MNAASRSALTLDALKFAILYISSGLLSWLVCLVVFSLDRALDPLYETFWGQWFLMIVVLGGIPGFLTMILSVLIRFNESPPFSKASWYVVGGSLLSMVFFFGFYFIYSPSFDELYVIPLPYVAAWASTMSCVIVNAKSRT